MNSKEVQKVAFFIATPGGPGGGGAERVIITIANEFAKRGIDTDLVLKNTYGPYMDLVSTNVNIISLRLSIGVIRRNPLNQIKKLWDSADRLHSYLRFRRPDILISAVTPENLCACIVKKLWGGNYHLVISQRDHMSSLIGWKGKILTRLLYPIAESVICVSGGVAEDLIRIVPKIKNKVKVIYNPVDIEKIELLAREEPEHPWFKDQRNQIILGAGGLKKKKAFPILLRAFAKVRNKRPVKLVILGDGPERKNLEALVSSLGLNDDVSLPGFTKNPFSYMSRAAVFVLSSSGEGLPNVLIEALACGCPVVSTDCPSGPREILEDGKWGELVPVGDVDALASAIERTLERPFFSEQLKARARFFSIDNVVNRFLEVLQTSSNE